MEKPVGGRRFPQALEVAEGRLARMGFGGREPELGFQYLEQAFWAQGRLTCCVPRCRRVQAVKVASENYSHEYPSESEQAATMKHRCASI